MSTRSTDQVVDGTLDVAGVSTLVGATNVAGILTAENLLKVERGLARKTVLELHNVKTSGEVAPEFYVYEEALRSTDDTGDIIAVIENAGGILFVEGRAMAKEIGAQNVAFFVQRAMVVHDTGGFVLKDNNLVDSYDGITVGGVTFTVDHNTEQCRFEVTGKAATNIDWHVVLLAQFAGITT